MITLHTAKVTVVQARGGRWGCVFQLFRKDGAREEFLREVTSLAIWPTEAAARRAGEQAVSHLPNTDYLFQQPAAV